MRKTVLLSALILALIVMIHSRLSYAQNFQTSQTSSNEDFYISDDQSLLKAALQDLLIKRKSSTFLVRVSGDSMLPTISTGSLLVVDKSIKAAHNSIVVAVVDGEFIVKELYLEKDSLPVLHSHNSLYEDIVIDEYQFLLEFL